MIHKVTLLTNQIAHQGFLIHLTLKIASTQVVELSVANNSPSQDSNHPDDLFQSTEIRYSSQNHTQSKNLLFRHG